MAATNLQHGGLRTENGKTPSPRPSPVGWERVASGRAFAAPKCLQIQKYDRLRPRRRVRVTLKNLLGLSSIGCRVVRMSTDLTEGNVTRISRIDANPAHPGFLGDDPQFASPATPPSRPAGSPVSSPMESGQNSAFPGVRAKGITSRILDMPLRNISSRSKPRPKPACGAVPYRRRSTYHE